MILLAGLTLAVLSGGLMIGNLGVPHACAKLSIHCLRKRCQRKHAVVLTFDDGPSERLTPAILDLLRRSGVKATFFPLGKRAMLHPELLDRVAAEGHEIGCHTFSHFNAWKVLPTRALADIRAGYQSLARWVPPDGVFRPPHGKLNLLTWHALRARGARVAWWTLDSGDTHRTLPSPESIAKRLIQQGGGVLLLHDFDRLEERETGDVHFEFVIAAASEVISAARSRGFEVLSLDQLGVSRTVRKHLEITRKQKGAPGSVAKNV